MPKVLVSDPIAQDGIDVLAGHAQWDVRLGLSPEELIAVTGEYEALVVRSETKVTAEVFEAAKKLQVVGRAGVGVDNIDLQAATNAGVIVVNAPLGNTISAAEHSIGLMLALARHIPARGPLIDEEALCRAVDEGRVAGAAIDVFAQEPPPSDNVLLKNDRILVTPHLGASTAAAQERE